MSNNNSTQRGLIYLGLDVAKDSIAVGILRPDEVVPDTEKIFHDEASVRRLINRFDDPRQLRACYEAGPTGYELYRLLASIGVRTDVVAPSLIPRVPGDHVKTDPIRFDTGTFLAASKDLGSMYVPGSEIL